VSEWSGKSGEFGGRIEDIAVDKDGNVFVADPITNSIKKMDTDGKLVAKFGGEASKKGNGLFYAPFGIAVDGKGFIYALDGNFLQKLDADGKCVAQWSTVGGDLDKASNVTVDSEGNIYVFAKADVTSAAGGTVSVFLLKKFSQSDSGW
jgi:DNA-binding beta-propeller fold protein YncE